MDGLSCLLHRIASPCLPISTTYSRSAYSVQCGAYAGAFSIHDSVFGMQCGDERAVSAAAHCQKHVADDDVCAESMGRWSGVHRGWPWTPIATGLEAGSAATRASTTRADLPRALFASPAAVNRRALEQCNATGPEHEPSQAGGRALTLAPAARRDKVRLGIQVDTYARRALFEHTSRESCAETQRAFLAILFHLHSYIPSIGTALFGITSWCSTVLRRWPPVEAIEGKLDSRRPGALKDWTARRALAFLAFRAFRS